MTAWHDTFPVFPPLLTSASAGREWNTDITEAVGRESRNAVWSEGRWRISIGGMKIRAAEVDAWDSFIDIVQGMAGVFLFRLRSTRFAIADQPLGTGTGSRTTFQLKKTRSYQGQDRDETILYPWHDYPPLTYATGSVALDTEMVQVSLNGVERQPGVHYTVNRDTGIVTFLSPPANGALVTATCKFMVLVRFSQDWNPVQSSSGKTWEIPGGVELVSPKGGE